MPETIHLRWLMHCSARINPFICRQPGRIAAGNDVRAAGEKLLSEILTEG